MTKRDLIKKILELGEELEKADRFNAVMIINDMEIEVDNYTKQLPILDVVGQSEQLKAVQKLKDFAYDVCPLHREDDLEEIVGSL